MQISRADFISEASALAEGDIVVHVDHGIGQFVGLRTIEAAGAPHDCLEIVYAGEAGCSCRSRISSFCRATVRIPARRQLDKLGGGAWQARKAKLKKRLLDMADQLIRIAAARESRSAPCCGAPEGLYDEFSARFPYDETEDQMDGHRCRHRRSRRGQPMDRLVCGDVGFGKTEVAIRAAFVAALNGQQVAVVVPTTLLARQHFRSFSDRFRGLPVKIAHASRLAGPKALALRPKRASPTAASISWSAPMRCWARAISFKNLGLLIVDEEQHFGVKHKERLKELKSDVHVLTLTATPIPRTCNWP
jgi:transcription-repair coupling factor (superfamily II helicase)